MRDLRKPLVQDIFEILSADLPSEEEEKLLVERARKMDNIVAERSKYYIAHFPKRDVMEDRWQLIVANDCDELFQGMAIKEGINMYETENGFKFVAYDGSYHESLFLYPIDTDKARELNVLIYNSDFPESVVIDAEIAQYMY